MKKLKLNLQQLDGVEVLTKSQLKQILGGDGSGGSTEAYGTCCTSSGDCGGVGCSYWITCNYTFTKC